MLRRDFALGGFVSARLGDGVPFAVLVKETVTVFDLSRYPPWLVVLVSTLVLALAIWLAIKLLKWALWLLFFGVLIGGLMWALWLVFT